MAKVQVALSKDVPLGTMKGFKGGEAKILISNLGGGFFGIGDKCSHKGCLLSKGKQEGEVVTCPCHGSKFNLKTGAVVKGPAKEPLQTYQITIQGDGIWVEV